MTTRGSDEADRDMLAGLLAGERAETDADVAERLRANPALSAELAALRRLAVVLEEGGRERAQELAEARGAVTDDDVAAARRALAGEGVQRRPRRTWMLVAAAAALLLAVLVVAMWPAGAGNGDPLLSSARDDVQLTPAGAGVLGAFTWRSRSGGSIAPPGGSLRIVVYRVRNGERTQEKVLEVPDLEGSEWRPSPAELEVLRREGEFWWELQAVDNDVTKVLKSARFRERRSGKANALAPVDEFSIRIRELGQRDLADAARDALEDLFADADTLRALRADRAAVTAAIEAGRATLAACPFGERVGYELTVAGCLTEVGLQEAALEALRGFLRRNAGVEPEAAVRETFASLLVLVAQLEHASGGFDEAIERARHARRLAREIVLADAAGVEARVWLDLGVMDEAWPLLELQRQTLERLGDPDPVARRMACLFEAEYYLKQDRIERAIAALERHGTDLSATPHLEIKRKLARVALAEQRGCRDLAAEAALRRELENGLAESESESSARILLARASLQGGDLQAVEQELAVLRRLQGSGGAADPMQWRGAAEVETLATRFLLRAYSAGAVDADALRAQLVRHRAAFDHMVAEWQATKVRPGGIGFLATWHRRQIVTELIRLVEATAGEAAAAEAAAAVLLRTQLLTSLARELGVGPDDAVLERVRSAFTGEQAGVLVFLADPNGSLALALDRSTSRLLRLPPSSELEAKGRDLQLALGAAATDADGAAAARRLCAGSRALGQALLTDELRGVVRGWSTVTIADFGMLGGVPWESLWWADGELLGERFAVNMLTSLPLGVMLLRTRRAEAPVAGVQFLGTLAGSPELVDPAAGNAMPLDRARIERMLGPYAARQANAPASIVLDSTATLAAASRLRHVAVTHLLAHGARIDGEFATGLALVPADGDRGFLGCAVAARLGMQGLVILSACGAGRGHRRIGDEALHATLGGAFLRAGAHTIVQSAADLRLDAHLRLMELVHAGVAAAKPTAVALQQARAVLARTSGWVERFEHAQVQVFGLGHVAALQ